MNNMETFFNSQQQAMLFLYSCLLGAVLGVAYDFFRIFRVMIKHGKVLVFFEDIIYIFICCISIFTFATELARGEIRIYFFIGAFLGFIVYYLTIGNVVLTAIRAIVGFVYKVLAVIFSPFKKLFSFIHQKINSVFVRINTKFKNNILNLRNRLKHSSQMMYNKSKHHKSTKGKVKSSNGSKNKGSKKAKKRTNKSS